MHLSGCRGLVWGAHLGFVLRFRAALVLVVIQARPALLGASLVAQWQRTCLPVWRTQETCIQSLDQEVPLGEEKAIHSGILAWTIPWAEEPGGLQSVGLQRAGHA